MLSVTPANAEPTPDSAPQIAYSAKMVDKAIVTTLRGGTFELSHQAADPAQPGSDAADATPPVDVVKVKDGAGNVLLSLPLRFRLGPIDIPVKPEVRENNTVLALTPDKPSGLTLTQPLAVKPVASQLENDRALNSFSTQFGLATTIGTFVGTAIGATIGCVATLVAGCLPGFMTGATVGGLIGSIAVGGPTLVAAGIDLLTTWQAPDGTTRWPDKTATAVPQPAAPQPAAQPSN
ncbi:hypothetical protein D7D52_09960 [Nocardia yunnanensis]|uniref:DUF8020 domain-containing protein n=1 Tax=Nocardia yunnanensis TaxID=2382165 RepID=A0A386ZMQ0_9NOCA|nr:hypothetical protein D7D52_09960 [Nocardia yunnanensis]